MTTGIIEHQGNGLVAPPTIKHLLERVNLIQEVMTHIMKEGTHYGGSFPGDTKKNLLKAGADSLGVAFQFVPEFEVIQTDLGGGHREYRTSCTIKSQQSGTLIATGVGTCSTMESKYRYRNAAVKCPTCGKEAIIKCRVEFGGGWVCFDKKGGCKAKFKDGDVSIEKQERGKVENTDPADVWNTVLKISKKRAFVDATITATGASDMFTQDAEDIADNLEAQKKKDAPPAAAQLKPEAMTEAQRQAKAGEEDQRPAEEQRQQSTAPAVVDEVKPSVKAFEDAAKKCKENATLIDLWEGFSKANSTDTVAMTAAWNIKRRESQRIKAEKGAA